MVGVPKIRSKPQLVDLGWILDHIPLDTKVKQESEFSYIVLADGPTIYRRILNAPSHGFTPLFQWDPVC
jgi:hypothetical protein